MPLLTPFASLAIRQQCSLHCRALFRAFRPFLASLHSHLLAPPPSHCHKLASSGRPLCPQNQRLNPLATNCARAEQNSNMVRVGMTRKNNTSYFTCLRFPRAGLPEWEDCRLWQSWIARGTWTENMILLNSPQLLCNWSTPCDHPCLVWCSMHSMHGIPQRSQNTLWSPRASLSFLKVRETKPIRDTNSKSGKHRTNFIEECLS